MNQKITLSDSSAVCELYPGRGGLLTSLQIAGQQLLWLPDDFDPTESSWPGGGVPLCFPFAGRVWNNGMLYQYEVDGTARHMPLHGFAFASAFGIKSSAKNSVRLILRDTEASRILFPFTFELDVSFMLQGDKLRIELSVLHSTTVKTESPMPVALGWHPYFRLQPRQETALEMPAKSFHHVTPVGAAGKRADCDELGPKPWNIRHPLLKSLILTDIASPSATLRGSTNVRLAWGPESMFNHVVLWSNQIDQFFCVEPWMSLPDAVATPSGCRWLKAGESLNSWLEISPL